MKIQKVIMGSLVLVFAVGSAVASTYFTTPVYVKASNDGPSDCVALDATCNDQTQNPCKVIVDTELQGEQTSSVTYLEAGCITPLFHNGEPIPASPVNPSITIFELLEVE
ncbi:DUF6520 family protein [Sinomicrobium soli]|uniref:DUF6520 family protein n=1 Tax=Sinomicrobium sp. N-1-3-6 TaxID=2219864 RepID=UPI000DCCF4FF|nr:DUF6520 family protein [Sinomicrobium sp. N-1-3-6]RAV29468.1 hypothetical protein DN748_08175 [Sinomicrobium sp. N-1-3-6]